MWIFTKYGFISVVQHNAMPGHFQVKSRVIDPLEILWPEQDIEIIDWADYRFRITLEKEMVNSVLAEETQEVESLGCQAIDLPTIVLPDVAKAIMQAMGPTLPKLNFTGNDSESTPKIR